MRPVLVLLAALRFALAADAGMAGYFPPDTKVVLGIHVRALADAGLFQEVAGSIPKELLPGFDVMKDLDEVLIGTSGEGKKPPALAVLRGRFNMEKFARDATRYNGVPVLGSVALIDETTAIAGDMELVHAAIDRRGQETQCDAAHRRAAREVHHLGIRRGSAYDGAVRVRSGLRCTACNSRPRSAAAATRMPSSSLPP